MRAWLLLPLALVTVSAAWADDEGFDWDRRVALFRKARDAYGLGQLAEAFRWYDRAAAVPPGTPDLQRRVADRVNHHRKFAMLVPVMPDPRVGRAAQHHAKYLELHTGEGSLSLEQAHREVAGRKGFTGVKVGDRLERQGFLGSSTETVTSETEPEAAVDHLVNTVYHRSGVFRPEARYVGYGVATRSVLDLAWPGDTAAEVDWLFYPGDGQEGVPPSFPGNETPEPLPGRRYPVGPPLCVGTPGQPPTVLRAWLRGPKGDVPLLRLDRGSAPSGDLLGAFVYLVPEQPLETSTRYQAGVRIRAPDRRLHERTWSFTTGATVPGQELWWVRVTELEGTPAAVMAGAPVLFTAALAASRPEEARLRWSVDGHALQDGRDLTFRWTPRGPGRHTVEAYAYYPAFPTAYGRRGLHLTVGGEGAADEEPPPEPTPTADPGARRRAALTLDPGPPWEAGTRVRMIVRPPDNPGPMTFTFVVDDRVVADGPEPQTVWVADGEPEHQFKATINLPEGSMTKTITLKRRRP